MSPSTEVFENPAIIPVYHIQAINSTCRYESTPRIAASHHSRSSLTRPARCNLLASRRSIPHRSFLPPRCLRLCTSHQTERRRHRPTATAHVALSTSRASTAATLQMCKILSAPSPYDVHDGCLAVLPPRFHSSRLAAGRPAAAAAPAFSRHGLLGRIRDRHSARRGLAVGATGAFSPRPVQWPPGRVDVAIYECGGELREGWQERGRLHASACFGHPSTLQNRKDGWM